MKDPRAFVEYSNNMQDVYKDIEQCNPRKQFDTLRVFDDVIVDMLSNKKLNPIVTELFIREKKHFLVLITQSGFAILRLFYYNNFK